jgi:hypothetical protein
MKCKTQPFRTFKKDSSDNDGGIYYDLAVQYTAWLD